MRYFVLACFCFCFGEISNAQNPRSAEPSHTINQRINPIWTDDSHFNFTRQLPDGSAVTYHVDAASGQIETLQEESRTDGDVGLRGGPLPRSQSSASETNQEFINASQQHVRLYWIDTQGNPVGYARLAPGQSYSQHTYAGHAWMVKADDGTFFGSLIAQSPSIPAKISRTFDLPQETGRRDRRGRGPQQSPRLSPDGQSEFRQHESGLQLRRVRDESSEWIELNVGDTAGQEIVSPTWSPDGSVLAAWKLTRHEPVDAVTIESSPSGGGRAIVKRHPYMLPGDPMDEYRLIAIDAHTGKRIDVELPVIDFGRPRIRWFGEHRIAIEKVDRGHQRVRLFVVDPVSRTTSTVIDERSDSFIWSSHGPHVPLFTFLSNSEQVIYSSECSGYRHLYLVDLKTGTSDSADSDSVDSDSADSDSADWRSNAITSGDWLVREIVHVDEQARTIDLLVGEYYDDQDPYHRHLVRVAMDDASVTAVTDGNGDHSVQFSPNRQFAIVTHSRVDSPPVHELRRIADGKLVTELMRAERLATTRIDENAPVDWSLPKVFHAPGRDGKTEIWGNLYFPDDFDAELRDHYPVIEAIYAGPHDSHVPKQYLDSSRFRELTSKGFVVVQIDGMGTANRSKAFHDVCWHNLKDAGFPDRIVWMKAAGKQYPAIDLSRVGVFGTSAGGQNACGALLFHGDFYKAAYAACGCHDNRMDKASWNEQWMGYPVDEHYAANSNIENAHRLSGDLFLVVGELDDNVPPESTYRLVDALVKADKNFEFLMIPGMGHSDGGRYGRRRMREFFVEKLKP
ncbi:MAG: prolyl oligopeptidase family serine peptidase [Planctomycetales bacterium]|nr:prolyl oligopeptidase family serine peptidase [Planctomycetales bacterium]